MSEKGHNTQPESPAPIPDSIRRSLNLQEEKDPALIRLASEEQAVLMCAVAPLGSVRVSPVSEVYPFIGIHEEFAFEAVIDEVESTGAPKKLLLLLNSPGGVLHSSFKVARALRMNFDEIEVYVPSVAASGGTMIAIAADKIIMGIMSQLSPVDPQVYYNGRQLSALTFRNAHDRLCEMFDTKTKDEAPYPEQAMAEKLDPFLMEEWNAAIDTAVQYATQILQLAKYGDNAAAIANSLVFDFPDHDYDLDFDRAKELGLRVERYDASARNKNIWRHFRSWLGACIFQQSGTHIVRYVLPQGGVTAREGGS